MSPIQDILLFAGHGTLEVNAAITRQRALSDANSSPAAIFLLTSCYRAFRTELASLSGDDLFRADIDLDDFASPTSLLDTPSTRYAHNTILTSCALFLIQCLRYIAFAHEQNASMEDPSSFLNQTLGDHLQVLGFSAGILPATVVASSSSTPEFVAHAVEVFKAALWMGFRLQLYRQFVRRADRRPIEPSAPWGLVIFGLDKDQITSVISSLKSEMSLCISAVTERCCVTVSGHPDHLQTFTCKLPSHAIVRETTLDSLYHSPFHASGGGARELVLADLARRQVRFPHFSDLRVPLRSTMDGTLLSNTTIRSQTLLESVIDMLMVQCVHWHHISTDLLRSENGLRFINVGPGTGLCRSMIRISPEKTTMLDLTGSGSTSNQNTTKQEPIAIVGMAANLPGASDLEALWKLLEDGMNTVSEIPNCRFNVADYCDSRRASRTMKARTGNFVDNVDEFDNKFFKISPREAKNMDPQQRLLLHASYQALEDSGYVPNSTPSFRQETFGVYVGAATHDYVENLRNEIDVFYSTGTLGAFLSGRISYAMQFGGPSVVVDTACSSSIVAIYQGCRALMNNDCNAALVGGVNVISSPDMFLGLDRGHFLSPTGQCKPFDASADGYSRSEGTVMFVLKRLSDAVAENDRVLGVIRGVEVNQSGLAHSITHPHAPTQSALFERLLGNSGVPADYVNVVEAHGTGTQAGDPNELKSIRSIFSANRSQDNPLHITSIKANVGHLEAASGVAGLAKLVLMLQHKTIPRQISLRTLNPKIDPLDMDNTVIDTVAAPWNPTREGRNRFAVLNNFGAAGSNSTLLLEEHPVTQSRPSHETTPCVFGMSAKSEVALEELRAKYMTYLKHPEHQTVDFADIAYTSTARRQVYPYRLAFSATNDKDLVQKLEKADIIHASEEPSRTVFVFSGQGGQYIGMGRELYRSSPIFKKTVDECETFLRLNGYSSVLPIIDSTDEAAPDTSDSFEAYQTSLFVLQLALSRLWTSWGMEPCAVVGHSLGEYAAMVTAGVISWRDALTIIAVRARLMVHHCTPNSTGMIAVNLGSEDVSAAIASSPVFAALSIACYNSPVDCVVAGPCAALPAFKAYLSSEYHCKSVILSVPFGYHSAAMAPLLDELSEVCRRIQILTPRIPIVSNVDGAVIMPGSTIDSTYFARHCRQPVLFNKGVTELVALPAFTQVDIWIEIGPHSTILPLLKCNAHLSRDSLLLPSLRKKQGAWTTLSTSLAQLYLSNVPIMWREVFAHMSPSCVRLPSYPLSKTKFWVSYKETFGTESATPSPSISPSVEYSMIGKWVQRPSAENKFVARFETPMCDLAPSILGHTVGDTPLCPASVYMEQALAGVKLALQHLGKAAGERDSNQTVFRGIEFAKPLVYNPNALQTVITCVTIGDERGSFQISSYTNSPEDETIHAHGEYRLVASSHLSTKFSHKAPVIERQIASVVSGDRRQLPEVFSTRTMYDVIFPRVVQYSKPYQSVQSLTVDPNGMEAQAIVRLPVDPQCRYVVHPVFTDTLLHVAGFVANLQGGRKDAYICNEIDSVKVIAEQIDVDASYVVYCNNVMLEDSGVMLCEAWAKKVGDKEPIVAHIKGIHFRRVQLQSLKKNLAHVTGHSPVIRSAPVTQPPSPHMRVRPLDHFKNEIMNIVAETCDVPLCDLDISNDLNSMGADSLMFIELSNKLQKAFPIEGLDAHELSHCHTIQDIFNEVSTRANSGASTPTLVSDRSTDDEQPTTPHVDVKGILAQILEFPVEEIKDDALLEDLGMDSLTSIEALRALEESFSVHLPSTLFAQHATPRAVNEYVSNLVRAPERTLLSGVINGLSKSLRLDNIPVPITTSSNRSQTQPSLFLFHDGSGFANYYDRLSLSKDRPTWGIHNPNMLTGEGWESLTQMATHYVESIVPKISGPVIVGGWSFGGVVSYEVARQLTKLGHVVQGILLIDSPSPIDHVALSPPLVDSILSQTSNIKPALKELVKDQFLKNTELLQSYQPPHFPSAPPVAFLRSREGALFDDVDVPSWLGDRTSPDTIVSGWQKLTGSEMRVFDIPGNHFEVFQPANLDEVSVQINSACEYLNVVRDNL